MSVQPHEPSVASLAHGCGERPALTRKSLALGLPSLLFWIVLIGWSLPNESLNQQHLILIAGFGAIFSLFALKYAADFLPERLRPNPAEMTFVFALLLAGIPAAVLGRMTLESAIANHFLESVEGGRRGIVPDLWAPNPHLGLVLKLNPPDARCPYVELPPDDEGQARRPALEPPPAKESRKRIEASAEQGRVALEATRAAAQNFDRSREVTDTLKEAEEAQDLILAAQKEAVAAGEKLEPRRAAYLAWAAETLAKAAERGPNCVTNADAVRGFRKGKEAVPWAVWLTPLGYWFLAMLAFLFIQLFGLTALREAWIEQERLPFPMAKLAEGVLRPEPAKPWGDSGQESFPRAAIGAAFFVGLLFAVRGMLSISETTGAPVPPTNALLDLDLTGLDLIHGVTMRLQLLPFALLMMMFFPLDLLFTVIAAFLVAEFGVPFVLDLLGITDRIGVRGLILRSGGMLGVTVFTLIFQRSELKRLVSGLWSRASGSSSSAPLSARELSAGFVLALGGFGALTLYGERHTGHSIISQGLMLLYVLLLIMIYNLPLMRMRGVGGFSYFEFNHILHVGGWFNWHWWKQVHTVPLAQGSQIVAPDLPLNYISLYQMESFGAYGQAVGPGMQFLDAYALAEATRARARDIFKGLALGVLLALLIVMPLYLIAAYHIGYDNTPSAGSWNSMYLTSDKASRYYTKLNPGIFTYNSIWWVVAGAGLMGACMYLRREYSRFPIEPLGLLIAGCDGGRTILGTDTLWFTFGAAWLLKWVLFRWYGVRFFQEKIMPLAVYGLMGMCLGILLYLFLSAVLLSRGVAF
ncbi:MAG: hypothetical protein HY291_16640 [Planctomycetes bacterium]|nr:hypothetical protein [Planctomycetota bacterium]